jgi:hypothetical protein
MVTTAPAETPRRARPRVLAEVSVCSLIAGMRTTQPAKTKPSRAKKTVIAVRSRVREAPLPGTALCVRGLFICGTNLRLGGCGHHDKVRRRDKKVRRWDESHPPRDLGSVHGT